MEARDFHSVRVRQRKEGRAGNGVAAALGAPVLAPVLGAHRRMHMTRTAMGERRTKPGSWRSLRYVDKVALRY